MEKFCPVCGIVLLRAGGACPSCREQFDAAGLPDPTKFELVRNLRELQRIQAARTSGGSGGGGWLSWLLGWLFWLAALGILCWTVANVDTRGNPKLAGGLGVTAFVIFLIGRAFTGGSRVSVVADRLRKDLELAEEVRRIEELHKQVAGK